MQKNNFLCRKFTFGREPFSKQCHSWLVFASRVILVPTIEWPVAHKKNSHWATLSCEKKIPFYAENLLLGINLFQNNACSWLVFPSRVILVPRIEWRFARIKSNLGQPFYVEKFLLVQKISFRHEPFSKQYP